MLQKLRDVRVCDWDKGRKTSRARPFGHQPLYYHATALVRLCLGNPALLAGELLPRKLIRRSRLISSSVGSISGPLSRSRAVLPGIACLEQRTPTANPGNSLRAHSSSRAEARSQISGDRREYGGFWKSQCDDLVAIAGRSISLGGIDSRAIVPLMSKVAGKTPKTVTWCSRNRTFPKHHAASLVDRKFGKNIAKSFFQKESRVGCFRVRGAMDHRPWTNQHVRHSKAVKDPEERCSAGLGGVRLSRLSELSRAKQ